MSKKSIVLTVDHKWRDLAGAVWAKHVLERMFGHRVVIARSLSETKYALALGPDALIVSQVLTPEQVEATRRLASYGVAIVILPNEGIPAIPEVLLLDHFIDQRHVDMYLAWGPVVATAVEDGDNPPKEISVIGVPRFDFYRQPLSSLLMSRRRFIEKYGVRRPGPIIFVPTNFTQAVFHGWMEEFNRHEFEETGLQNVLSISPDEVARHEHASRALLADAVERLRFDFPDAVVVVKPHPNESHTFWKEWAAHAGAQVGSRAQGVLVTQEFVWDLLNVADIVLGRNCTTSTEAWFLGKPTVECRLNHEEQWYFSEERVSGSVLATSYGELSAHVSHFLAGGSVPDEAAENQHRFIERWCPRVDGRATLRLAETIDALLSGRPRPEVPLGVDRLAAMLKVAAIRLTGNRITDWRAGNWRRGQDNVFGRSDRWFYPSDAAVWSRRLAPLVRHLEQAEARVP